ncbi:MAG: Polyribonucleotide nucleotidyltransferase, partial [uncultured Solirubrobacteraceae bacterium]
MSQVHRVSVDIGGREIAFETGKLAKQASGAVVMSAGDTIVLSTATAGNQRDVDFLPLTVDVEERMYAAGKIPGSFFKREGRAGEKATLIARLIDRPLRPLFPKGWRHETQLVATTLSVDHANPYDILAMNGASAALMISEIPFPMPVGSVRIGKVEGNFVVNPTEEELLSAEMDLVVAGTEEAILMVEAGASEVSEAEILDALDIAHGAIKKLCAAQRELAEKACKPKLEVVAPQADPNLVREIQESHGEALAHATQVEDKIERQNATKAVEQDVLDRYSGEVGSDTYAEYRQRAQLAFDKLEKTMIRERIAVHKRRPDGRSATEIRNIDIDVTVLPRAHGSAVFTRGQTQALSVVALGTTREEMRLDNLGLETSKRYFHHYNFPPFSVGEAGFMRGPKRRDIGHGALAERALVPMIPSQDDFPYTIRVVSDILESNGSSSMASVCGSSLSLMDAGVPLKRPVAGVAMGLIKEGDAYTVLTDIAGVEDHLGDMDFKVAGTENGITALQMDIKITGVTFDILRDALAQARDARLFILGKMNDVISTPRTELSKHAPRISTIQIDTNQIGMIIGKGGETIRALQEEFESQIDISEDGTILVYAASGEKGDALVDRIRSMTKEVAVGDEYTGKVVKT